MHVREKRWQPAYQRIRLKRPASARQLDGKLDFDPYRTTIGTTDNQRAMLVLAVAFGVLIFAFLLACLLNR